jgi:antitoxin (DNA-binding transcriptional repressor) of toxin-antitoxin stability system
LKSGNDTINKSTTNVMMEVFTVKEYQDRWDELMERVENGETFGIVNEDGQAAVMMPADDETMRIYTENNNEAS